MKKSQAKFEGKTPTPPSKLGFNLFLTAVNIGILLFSFYYYSQSRANLDQATQYKKEVFQLVKGNSQSTQPLVITQSSPPNEMTLSNIDGICNDEDWCNIPMPSESYFKFDPPTDPIRWKRAQIQAANGEQVLLERISRVFPDHFDFLDGDRLFRRTHYLVDLFVDGVNGLDPLLPGYVNEKTSLPDEENGKRRYLKQSSETFYDGDDQTDEEDGDEKSENEAIRGIVRGREENTREDNNNYNNKKNNNHNTNDRSSISQSPSKSRPSSSSSSSSSSSTFTSLSSYFSSPSSSSSSSTSSKSSSSPPQLTLQEENLEKMRETRKFIPAPYNFRYSLRSPIVQMGYMQFQKNANSYFSGNHLGFSGIEKNAFFSQWRSLSSKFDVPFILLCTLNENWGMLSTMMPNRTAGWGQCCNKPGDKVVHDFLSHPKTLMLATNQHVNLTHPKLLILPRGLPLQWENTGKLVWDSIRLAITQKVKKNRLLFASASSWGPRPQILQCISNKFSPSDFEGHSQTPPSEMAKTKKDRSRYYEKLAGTRFGVALPGLGYDTFRMWELLTMGSIPIVEKGVGFDRTLWRLPALIVEDFDYIEPFMLKQAYAEALYRADDFEFERLTQSFWWRVFSNVSVAMSIEPLLEKFPMKAVDEGFARPRIPYACGLTDPFSCGEGTKRIPRRSC